METNNNTEERSTSIKEVESCDLPQMSNLATIGNMFFEPGRVFDDLRRKPRFLLAGLIFIGCISLFQIIFIEKVGFREITRSRIETGWGTRGLDEATKKELIEQQNTDTNKYVTYVATPVIFIIVVLFSGLLYWGAASAFGGTGKFRGALSVWLYSSVPPMIVSTIANLIVLFLKPVEDIDIASSQEGLIKANPSFFVDPTAYPVLSALLSTFDLFAIWGWVLACIGLKRVFKLSSASAWAVVLIIALIGLGLKLVAVFFSQS